MIHYHHLPPDLIAREIERRPDLLPTVVIPWLVALAVDSADLRPLPWLRSTEWGPLLDVQGTRWLPDGRAEILYPTVGRGGKPETVDTARLWNPRRILYRWAPSPTTPPPELRRLAVPAASSTLPSTEVDVSRGPRRPVGRPMW